MSKPLKTTLPAPNSAACAKPEICAKGSTEVIYSPAQPKPLDPCDG